jgi:hypothetical protein
MRGADIDRSVLVTDHRLSPQLGTTATDLGLDMIGAFGGAIVQAENYFVYAASLR